MLQSRILYYLLTFEKLVESLDPVFVTEKGFNSRLKRKSAPCFCTDITRSRPLLHLHTYFRVCVCSRQVYMIVVEESVGWKRMGWPRGRYRDSPI